MSLLKLISAKHVLFFICLLFLFTRLYKISEIPISVYWDEASIGYNAFSIAQTGKDEWGDFLPLHLRAFGEFKLPVYIYATVPSVMVFGLNAFAVRLPSVLFSLGVVILTYFLAKKLWGSETVALLSSFFVTISPWFFIFSRTGYEATAGLMFYLLAIYFFLEYARNSWYILFSIASFILSAYSYNSFRLIVPPTILILIFYEIKNLATKRNALPLILSAAILILSVIPIYRLVKFDAGTVRLQVVSASSSDLIKNYLSHFSPDFLFLNGDKNLRSQQAGFGQVYLPDLILLPLGLLFILQSKSKYKLLPLLLLLLGPIPAAITKESPHALRAVLMVSFLSIIFAAGVAFICQWTSWKKYIILVVSIVFVIFFANYFWNFLHIYPTQSAQDWQFEYKKIYTNYANEFDRYRRILISDQYAQPYIFALFYLKYDPQKFRQEVVRNEVSEWGFSTVKKFGKFEFGKFSNFISLEK